MEQITIMLSSFYIIYLLFVCLSVSIYRNMQLYAYLYICLPVCLYVSLIVCVSGSVSLHQFCRYT